MATTRLPEDEIRQSYFKHATNAQLFRWYQYYENNEVGIQNQLDLLTEDFSIDSPSGSVTSRNQYEDVVKSFPASWKNSHKVNRTNIKVIENNALSLDAEIEYANIGMAPGQALSAQELNYQATLVYNDTILPQFNRMVITGAGAANANQFKDTYVENRLKSLIHYLMAIVEHPSREVTYLPELLAPKFDIKLSEARGTFTTLAEMEAWLTGPVACMSATRHIAHDLTYKTLSEGKYEMTVYFDWDGIRQDGAFMTAKTRHTWIVLDNPSERFARIKQIRVQYLEPYAVID